MKVTGCSRCRGNHDDVEVRPLIEDQDDEWTHYFICPATHRIVFVRYTDPS